MKLLPVHCCCSPAERLGYLEVPDHLAREGPLWVHQAPRWVASGIQQGATIQTEVARLYLGDGRELLAVKSAHLPLEQWQRVRGFRVDP